MSDSLQSTPAAWTKGATTELGREGNDVELGDGQKRHVSAVRWIVQQRPGSDGRDGEIWVELTRGNAA